MRTGLKGTELYSRHKLRNLHERFPLAFGDDKLFALDAALLDVNEVKDTGTYNAPVISTTVSIVLQVYNEIMLTGRGETRKAYWYSHLRHQ